VVVVVVTVREGAIDGDGRDAGAEEKLPRLGELEPPREPEEKLPGLANTLKQSTNPTKNTVNFFI
jgi:hypothetical protein